MSGITADKPATSKTIAENDAQCFEFVTALNADGLDVYAYMVIDKAKKASFDAALKKPTVDLETLGKVVESGYGELPDKIRYFELIEEFNDGEF